MFKSNLHIVRITGLSIVTALLFSVLFGQGAHLHELDVHIGSHFDVHAHVHAHESQDEPFQAEDDQEKKDHRHEVSNTDIVGTVTCPYQFRTKVQSNVVIALDVGADVVRPGLQQIPAFFDLPPPLQVADLYHLSSFSRRGPPVS